MRLALIGLSVALLLSGCGTGPTTPSDGAPPISLDPERISDATPRRDPVTRAGNKNPYTVLGKTYHLLPQATGYRAKGIASWYGSKFHGRPTANGEPYSLYGMTAAHKTLPIPCYVKVTNLNNGRTAVVRVNDRGPFHDDRLIDLSYAAAVKLGFDRQGTAPVEIAVIDSDNSAVAGVPTSAKSGATAATGRYLQVAAFTSQQRAEQMRQRLSAQIEEPVVIRSTQNYFRVRIGPLLDDEQVTQVKLQLETLGISKPALVSE